MTKIFFYFDELFQLFLRLGYIRIAEILVMSGVNVNHINNDGNTSLHIAIREGFNRVFNDSLRFVDLAGQEEISELLIVNGAGVNIVDREERTALHWASNNGNYAPHGLLMSILAHFGHSQNCMKLRTYAIRINTGNLGR